MYFILWVDLLLAIMNGVTPLGAKGLGGHNCEEMVPTLVLLENC